MSCDHCEELAERVRQLEATLYNKDWDAPREFGLTPMEARILATLLARDRTCSNNMLIDATRDLGGIKRLHPTGNVIDAKICHLRNKLKPFGLWIETVWGAGYRLDNQTRSALRNWRKAEAA